MIIFKKIKIKNIKDYNKIKDKIAFIYYGNINYKEILHLFSLGDWLNKNKIKIYILNQNIHTIIKDEKLNKSNKEVALILIDDIIPNININNNFKVMYEEKLQHCKIYGRVNKIANNLESNTNIFEVNNKSNLQINNNFISILKNLQYISNKNYYENLLLGYVYDDEVYNIDILKTSFDSSEKLIQKLNITYNCHLTDSNLTKINIKNSIDIFINIFAPNLNKEYLSKKDEDDIEKGIKDIENIFGEFITLYTIKDNSEISPFYININQLCIIFKKVTLVITRGSDE